MGARCGLRGQGHAAHSGGTLVHPLPTCWLCHALQVLGTPTLEEIQAMNQNYTEYKFPQARAGPPLEAAAASLSVRTPRPSHLPPLPRSSRRSSRTRGTRSSAPARRRTPSSWSRASCAIRPTRASSPSRLARCPSSTSCVTKACSCRATAPLRLCSTLSRKVRSHAPRLRVCAAARGAARTALTACSPARRRTFRASAQHQKQANARMVQSATAMSRCARAVNRQLRACLFIAAS